MRENETQQKAIAKLLSETLRDVGDYPKAILELGPYLTQEQLIKLWEQAIGDLRSNNTELAWFAHFSLRNLASVFSSKLRVELITADLIQEFHTAMHTRRDVIASIIFAKSQAVSAAERESLQIDAIKRFYEIRGENGSKYVYIDDDLLRWIRDNGSSLDSNVVWWIWKQCTELALTGVSGEKPKFYGLVKDLAEIVPIEHIDEACVDCYGFYKAIKHYLEEPVDVIRVLISQLPLSQQKAHWKSIYIYLLQQEKDEENFKDPLKFAGRLISKMPEPLQPSAFDYFYTITSGDKIRHDPTFEGLWKWVDLEK